MALKKSKVKKRSQNSSSRTNHGRKSSCQGSRACKGETGRNSNYPKNRKSRVAPQYTKDEIVAWADHLTGVPSKETQSNLGIAERTYSRYVKNVEDGIKQSINIDELREVMLMLFSLALKSTIHNLEQCHPGMTIGYLKGIGVFKEHLKGETMGKDQYFMFGDEVINAFADKTLAARRKDGVTGSNRLKAFGLSDSGDTVH